MAAQPQHDLGSFAAIQTDIRSDWLLRLRGLLQDAAAFDDAEVRSLIAAWDGYVRTGSPAAAILETTLREAGQAIVRRAAGEHGGILLGRGLGAAVSVGSFGYRAQALVVKALEMAAPPWCDDKDDRDRVLRAAAARARGLPAG